MKKSKVVTKTLLHNNFNILSSRRLKTYVITQKLEFNMKNWHGKRKVIHIQSRYNSRSSNKYNHVHRSKELAGKVGGQCQKLFCSVDISIVNVHLNILIKNIPY